MKMQLQMFDLGRSDQVPATSVQFKQLSTAMFHNKLQESVQNYA